MKTEVHLCQSGIVFPLMSRVSPELATALLAEIFARRGEDMQITRQTTAQGPEIVFQGVMVTLRLHLAEDRARLRLTRPGSGVALNEAAAQALLAALTATLVRGFAGETVLWLRKDVVLPAARFLAAVDPVRPRRVQTAQPEKVARPARVGSVRSEAWVADIQADQQMALARLMREAEDEDVHVIAMQQPSIAVRLMAAVVTLFVALFSLPLAAALLVWNTLRGGDLRASTTVLTALSVFTLMMQIAVPDLAQAMNLFVSTGGL